MPAHELSQYLPVGIMLLVAISFALINIILPRIIGKKRTHHAIKDSAYECGMPPLAEAHARFSVKFYLIAMLFILFDIEVIFLLGWGAVYRDLIVPVEQGGIGLPMLWGMLLFLGLLELGHLYAWKKGALDWAPVKKSVPQSLTPSSVPKA